MSSCDSCIVTSILHYMYDDNKIDSSELTEGEKAVILATLKTKRRGTYVSKYLAKRPIHGARWWTLHRSGWWALYRSWRRCIHWPRRRFVYRSWRWNVHRSGRWFIYRSWWWALYRSWRRFIYRP